MEPSEVRRIGLLKENQLTIPHFVLHASATPVLDRLSSKKKLQQVDLKRLNLKQNNLIDIQNNNYILEESIQLINNGYESGSQSSISTNKKYTNNDTDLKLLVVNFNGNKKDVDYRNSSGNRRSANSRMFINEHIPDYNLGKIDLERQNLKSILYMEDVSQIRLLNLSRNNIELIENVRHLNCLVYLDLYDNHIENIENLESLQSLKVLMLGKNKIKTIENLDNLSLDVLDLHNNQIRQIENLDNQQELKVLNLSGNLLCKVENLSSLKSLVELNLKRNYIKTIKELHMLPNLQKLYISFNEISKLEDIECLLKCEQLFELTLDHNPLYKAKVNVKIQIITSLANLVWFESKKITDDVRRQALSYLKKEREKKEENLKMAAFIEKRSVTISNARKKWESGRRQKTSITMPDLYARDELIRDESDGNEKSSNYSRHPRKIENVKEVLIENNGNSARRERTKSFLRLPTVRRFRRRSRESLNPDSADDGDDKLSLKNFNETKEDDKFSPAPDSLAELEGDTLKLFGPGSLGAFDKNWGIQAAGCASSVHFSFIDFDDIVRILPRMRIRFPNIINLTFTSTNITTLHQLNALSRVKKLESLTIESESNPITSLLSWKQYAIFRLGYLGLKKINGETLSSADQKASENYYNPLSQHISKTLPSYKLMALFNDKRNPVPQAPQPSSSSSPSVDHPFKSNQSQSPNDIEVASSSSSPLPPSITSSPPSISSSVPPSSSSSSLMVVDRCEVVGRSLLHYEPKDKATIYYNNNNNNNFKNNNTTTTNNNRNTTTTTTSIKNTINGVNSSVIIKAYLDKLLSKSQKLDRRLKKFDCMWPGILYNLVSKSFQS